MNILSILQHYYEFKCPHYPFKYLTIYEDEVNYIIITQWIQVYNSEYDKIDERKIYILYQANKQYVHLRVHIWGHKLVLQTWS